MSYEFIDFCLNFFIADKPYFKHRFTLMKGAPTDAKKICRCSGMEVCHIDRVKVSSNADSLNFTLKDDKTLYETFFLGTNACRLTIKVHDQDLVATFSMPNSADTEIDAIRKQMRKKASTETKNAMDVIDQYLARQTWINEARLNLKPIPESGWTPDQLLHDLCVRNVIDDTMSHLADEQKRKHFYAEVLKMVSWNIAIPKVSLFVNSDESNDMEVQAHKGFEYARRTDYEKSDPFQYKLFKPSFDALIKLSKGMHIGFRYCLTPVVKINSYQEHYVASFFERLGKHHEIKCWLKPQFDYFHIYLADGSRWSPDYVLEDETKFWCCVINRDNSALRFAKRWAAEASVLAKGTGYKPWQCLAIPQDDLTANRLRSQFSLKNEWIQSHVTAFSA